MFTGISSMLMVPSLLTAASQAQPQRIGTEEQGILLVIIAVKTDHEKIRRHGLCIPFFANGLKQGRIGDSRAVRLRIQSDRRIPYESMFFQEAGSRTRAYE